MFKLIRDNIPELAKQSGKPINYAKAENDEFYIILLKNKLIEEVQEFLLSGQIEELVDVETVLKALIKVANVSETDFNKLYTEKLNINGGFEKHYIGFFPDQAPEASDVIKPGEE